MLSLKQLEALHWIVELGTFERAAQRLSTTQSTISKRIQDLEQATGLEVFDRSQRGARLTPKGEALLLMGRQILTLSEQILDLQAGGSMPLRTLRLGVTELTAWTWLPKLVSALQARYPTLVLEPEVELARVLYERLRDGQVDMIIIPDTFRNPDVMAVMLAEVENAWMAKPGVVRPSRPLTLQQLAGYPVLTQGKRSGSGMHFSRWLKSQGVEIPRMIASDSLNAMLGMTVAGLGVSYVPAACFRSLVDSGKLEELRVSPSLPPVPYTAMYMLDRPTSFIEEVVDLAKSVCDFSRPFQA